LCDVPCTGLGNLRRHPEIRWFREYADIRARAELQLQIARTCAGLLAGAGRMVYAACSTEPEETSRVVAELVAGGSVRLAGERTWTPEDDDTDGFYCALLMECS
jgi:16S rRNA (cytosine967-C5)-methyltransferase